MVSENLNPVNHFQLTAVNHAVNDTRCFVGDQFNKECYATVATSID